MLLILVTRIIPLITTNILVILISGGLNFGARRSVEAIFPNGTNLRTLPDLPIERSLGRFDHSQDGFTACSAHDCVTLSDGQWKQSHTLLYDRYGHTSWTLGDGRIVLMGGWSRNFGTTTEIITPGSPINTEGFNLKYYARYMNKHLQ